MQKRADIPPLLPTLHVGKVLASSVGTAEPSERWELQVGAL